jgi:hypothetical protein
MLQKNVCEINILFALGVYDGFQCVFDQKLDNSFQFFTSRTKDGILHDMRAAKKRGIEFANNVKLGDSIIEFVRQNNEYVIIEDDVLGELVVEKQDVIFS